jgi:uncharacterized membrane protein YdbT with pleckstrin-like domain
MPKGYVQNMLAEQERILLITRQHWFVIVGAIFLESILLFITLIIIIVTSLSKLPELAKFIIVGLSLLVVFGVLLSAFRDWLIWHNRQYIISTRRVIQIEGVINKNVTDSSLEKVNDVKLSQSFLGRIFGYGDVEILTASELGVNLFRRIGKPVRFKTTMLNSKEELERGSESGVRHKEYKDREDVPALIAKLDELHKQGVLTDEEFRQKKAELLAKM